MATVSSELFTAVLRLACQENINAALSGDSYGDKLNVRLPFSLVRARVFSELCFQENEHLAVKQCLFLLFKNFFKLQQHSYEPPEHA